MNGRGRAAAFAVGMLAGALPPLSADRLNAEWLAAIGAWTNAPAPASDVALVLVDDRATAHPEFAMRPRAYWSAPLAKVVTRVLDAGATTVALDLILTRPDALDPKWLAALRRGSYRGRIVLGGTAIAWPATPQVAAAGGIQALAAVNLPRGQDLVVRSVPPTTGHLPTLGAAVAQRNGAGTADHAPLPRARLPRFVAWSAAEVIDCDDPHRLADAFAGRSVFIGAWLPHEDRHASPLRRLPAYARALELTGCGDAADRLVAEDPVPGVLLHALAADGWMHARAHWSPGVAATWAATGGATLIGIAAAANHGLRWLMTAIVAATFVATLAFLNGWLMPWLGCTAAALAAAVTTVIADNAHAAWRFAATLPRRFRADPGRATVQRLTACFIDIESFTGTSEQAADPAHLARELGRCLATLGRIAEEHGGFVDKYIGDALLVLFGPERGDDGRADALAAVTACLAACAGPETLHLCGHPVRLRIGLACGDARVGALGDSARVHFTAIGDAVNVAARLEQLNRALGTRVLADAPVAAAAPGGHWRDRGLRELRGRTRPVQVFELVGTPTVANTHSPYNQRHARSPRSGTRHPDAPGQPRQRG